MRRRTWGLTLALSLTLLGAACSDDSEDPADPDRGDPGDFSVSSSLEQLPASEDVVFVSVADVAAVREANDLEPPDPADVDRVGDYLLRMTGVDEAADAMLSPPASSQRLGVQEAGLFGFSWMEADRLASVYAPPEEFTWTAYDGPVQPADGLVDAGDGMLRPADDADPLSGELLFATDGDQAVSSRSSEDIAAWRTGEGDTLADDEELAAVAAALDEEGVVSAYLLTGAGERSTLGLGWRVDGEEPGFVVAYDAGDPEAAAAAVDGIRTDYEAPEVAEQLALEDVTSDGRVVVVTAGLAGRSVQVLLQMLVTLDLPAGP